MYAKTDLNLHCTQMPTCTLCWILAHVLQDETVTVIRQVDDNWLEGKKGDKIGIFPVSFVKVR